MRYLVVGTSGSGKSTFAQEAARRLSVPHVELDKLFWGPNWTAQPTEEFTKSVQHAALGERWVIDGNYALARPVLWPRATHVVWLNLSRTVVFSRVFRRTVRRAFFREELWHGNRESIRKSFFSRESILLWSLSTYAKNQANYAKLREQPEFASLKWVELRRPSEVRKFLSALNRSNA
jgi:adenylate kinase family enzyme